MFYASFAKTNIKFDFECKGLEKYFEKFLCQNCDGELEYTIEQGKANLVGYECDEVVSDEFVASFFDGGYLCRLNECAYVDSLFVTYDGNITRAVVYVNEIDESDVFCDEVFDIMKFAFYNVAQKKHMIAMHAASIIYNGRAILFSANSGVGKSTHTNLWRQTLEVAPFNGDVTLIGLEGECAMCYAIPWCGSSGLYHTENIPLGGICFLNRGKTNYTQDMGDFESVMHIIRYCFSNNLTPKGMNLNLEIAQKIVSKAIVFKLFCLPDADSVFTSKKYIDENLK